MFSFKRAIAPITVAVVIATLALGAGSASAATLHRFTTHPTPKLTSAPRVGLALSVHVGSWKPRATTFTYQWKENSHSIVGATSSRYTPVVADLGKRISVSVTAHKAGYASYKRTSALSKKVVYQTFMTKAGLYKVGSKVKPGTYVARHAGATCYWQRIGQANVFGAIIGQNYLRGQAVATILPTDTAFQTGGCGAWMKLSDVPVALKTSIPSSGVYLVNTQLNPGVWKTTTAGSACTWKTVRSFSGLESTDVISHGEPTSGTAEVTLTSDIAGFLVANCGTWTRTGDVPTPQDPAPAQDPATN